MLIFGGTSKEWRNCRMHIHTHTHKAEWSWLFLTCIAKCFDPKLNVINCHLIKQFGQFKMTNDDRMEKKHSFFILD